MKKIALTGSTGFVGTYFRQFFSRDDISILNLRNDILDIPESSEVIVHLAGKAHDISNFADPSEYDRINYEMTRKLFDLFVKSNATDFVFLSSVKSVADTVDGVLTEITDGLPVTPYGISKLKAEKYLMSFDLPLNKRVFILRPCMIHGPGNKGNLNLLYKMVKRGIPYPLGAFENRRSFLSIDNLMYVLARIINDSSIPGGIYNVADDDPLSTKTVIGIIAESSEVKGGIWPIPKDIIAGIAKIGDIFRLPLNSERLKKLTESYVVSNSKIKNVLGIREFPLSSKDGMIKTIRSFRN